MQIQFLYFLKTKTFYKFLQQKVHALRNVRKFQIIALLSRT